MLICLGAALFTIVSSEMAGDLGGDRTRIAAQVIPGIGFIGAGVVIRQRGVVVGITSAATIFVVGGIGMAVGSNLEVTAVFTTLLLLGSLVIIGKLEDRFGLHSRMMSFRVSAAGGADMVSRVRQIVDELGLQTRRWHTNKTDQGLLVEFEAELTVPQERELVTRLGALNAHCEARPVPDVTAL